MCSGAIKPQSIIPNDMRTLFKSYINNSCDIFNPSWHSDKSIVNTKLIGRNLTLYVDAGAYEEIVRMATRYSYDTQNQQQTEQIYSKLMEQVKEKNAVEMGIYEYEMLKWRNLPDDEKEVTPKPKKPSSKDIRPDSSFFLTTEGERNAFVKCYFLYEFLLGELRLSGMFRDEDFQKSLKGMKEESISCKRGSVKARKILGLGEGVLYVDSNLHKKSSKSSSSIKQKFEYVFHPITYRKDINNITIPLCYYLTETLHTTISIHYEFYINPEQCLSIQDMLELVKRIFKQNHICASARTTLLKPCNELNFSNICKNGEDGWRCKDEFGFEIYIPNYFELELSSLPQKVLIGNLNVEELKKWEKYRNEEVKITSVSRLWHPFHCLPREYRKYVCHNGSPLVEAMDVKNCYYVLMSKVLMIADGIDPGELNRFMELVRYGDIYSEMGKDIQFVRHVYEDDGDDEYLAFIGITRRDKIKLEMQSFRNFKTYGQAESQHPMLAKKFKQMFPTICRWLFTYPNYVNSKGKNTKRLQKDMSQIETMLISKVCFRLKAMGLNPFTLHDAVYLSEAELNTLEDGAVDKLFWEIFDAVTAEDVRGALKCKSDNDRNNV